MKREYRKRKDEILAQWTQRLADTAPWDKLSAKEVHDILREVCIKSYIEGQNVATALYKRYN